VGGARVIHDGREIVEIGPDRGGGDLAGGHGGGAVSSKL
jgi:hypothetical protein